MEVEAAAGGRVAYGERVSWCVRSRTAQNRTGCPRCLLSASPAGSLHYWLDRAVYRFSDPGVRTAARARFAPAA
jgi:hypothetical protein